jgi:NTE family protein
MSSAPGPGSTSITASAERVNLIMGGGGVRLAAYVGALAAFEAMGVEIRRIAGASAGSIVGSLLAAGWSVERIRLKLLDTNFTQFKDLSLRGFLLEGGLYAGNRFERWMDEQLDGVVFRDLPRDLFVTAVDLFGRRPFFFSRFTTPDMRVSQAVRCSMAIPWVWRPLRLEQKLLADGQLMPWIPNGLELMTRHGADSPEPRTIMLRLVSDPLTDLPARRYLFPWDFAKILLDTMLGALENQRVPGSLWGDTILINCGNIRTLQFALSLTDKERLWNFGFEQTKKYYKKGAR